MMPFLTSDRAGCSLFELLRGEKLGPPLEAMKSDNRDDVMVFLQQDRQGMFNDWAKYPGLQRVRALAASWQRLREEERQAKLRQGAEQLQEQYATTVETALPPAPLPEPPPGSLLIDDMTGRTVCRCLRLDPMDEHPLTYAVLEATGEARALLEHLTAGQLFLDVPPPGNVFITDPRWQHPYLGASYVLGLADIFQEPKDPSDPTVVRDNWRPARWYMITEIVQNTLAFAKGQRLTLANREAGPFVAARLEKLENRR